MVLKTVALLVLLNNVIDLSARGYWWYIRRKEE
jgi:hypothetical protein